jgi:hypothetical protein
LHLESAIQPFAIPFSTGTLVVRLFEIDFQGKLLAFAKSFIPISL